MSFVQSQIEAIKALLDWRVTLDIVIIALVIFFLYHTLRTTGAGKIFIGILLAAGLFLLARFLNLRGIDWIYSNLSQVLLLGLIILFQPELRKIFERAASIRPHEPVAEGSKLAYVLSEAALALGAQKRGALIVVPGKESIKSLTSTGIAIDAEISLPLLMSIFDPHSPGHDGAVVVERGRLGAFGVRLPLAQTSHLPERFGTRHHAALSLSQASDALIIAVSEERGVVTLFHQGEFSELGDKNALTTEITAHLQEITSVEFPGLTSRHRKTVLVELAVSFVLAFLFWSTIVLSQAP